MAPDLMVLQVAEGRGVEVATDDVSKRESKLSPQVEENLRVTDDDGSPSSAWQGGRQG